MFAIGEAARRSGVSIETIRYYEREGIIRRAGRSSSGRRLYGEDEIAELAFIRKCRDLGFSIPDIRALISLSAQSDGACGEVETLARRHLAGIREKISDLQKMQQALEELVKNCARGSVRCSLLEKLQDGSQQRRA